MGYRYNFKCECANEQQAISFVSDDFINPYSGLLTYLDCIWWEVDRAGKVVAQLGNSRWPPELSRRYFNTAARKYAARVLSGKELIWCGHCEGDIVVEKE